MKKQWQNVAKELGIDSVVEWGASKPHDEFLQWIRGIDIYAFPSNRIEGWGATLVEAMDAGCAVVANSEAGVTLEVIKDGANGYVFSDNDVGLMAKHLEALIEDAGLRQRFGCAAWKTIQKWSPKVGAERISSLVSDLLAGGYGSSAYCGLCQNIR